MVLFEGFEQTRSGQLGEGWETSFEVCHALQLSCFPLFMSYFLCDCVSLSLVQKVATHFFNMVNPNVGSR